MKASALRPSTESSQVRVAAIPRTLYRLEIRVVKPASTVLPARLGEHAARREWPAGPGR